MMNPVLTSKGQDALAVFLETLPLAKRANAMAVIHDYQRFFEDRLGKGLHCVCGRWGKLNRRPMNVTMVRGFLWLYSRRAEGDNGFINIQEQGPPWLLRSKQLSTMKHWGVIEGRETVKDDEGKKDSGDWRVTPLGIRFANNAVRLPKVSVVYDDVLVDVSEETILISDVQGRVKTAEPFSYEEVMREVPMTEDIRQVLRGSASIPVAKRIQPVRDDSFYDGFDD